MRSLKIPHNILNMRIHYGGEMKESACDFVNELMFVYVNSRKTECISVSIDMI